MLGLTLHHYGRVDIWVNNAGFGMADSAADMDMSVCRDLFDTNYSGAVASHVGRYPDQRPAGWRRIINVSSVAGHVPLRFNGAYSASKFAMNALGKGARIELKDENIDVLTVCPGYVRTNFQENIVRGKTGKRVDRLGAQGLPAKGPATLQGYLKRKREVVVPWTMHPVIKLYQLFPGIVEWGMVRMLEKRKTSATPSSSSQ